MSETGLLEAVREVAHVGAAAALRYFRGTLRVDQKNDGSPVSEADREAERLMREWIARRFPRDGILGEELGEQQGGDRRWIIDPIDGTRSFVSGVPYWGTLVAVAEGERILAGAIVCPAVGEVLCAAQGEGCWHNGARARVSGVSDIRVARRASNDCYGYVLVATGRAEFMVDPVAAAWDAAAIQPVIEEAGGVFTDWSGRPTAFGGSIVATNGALADEVRAQLARGGGA